MKRGAPEEAPLVTMSIDSAVCLLRGHHESFRPHYALKFRNERCRVIVKPRPDCSRSNRVRCDVDSIGGAVVLATFGSLIAPGYTVLLGRGNARTAAAEINGSEPAVGIVSIAKSPRIGTATADFIV